MDVHELKLDTIGGGAAPELFNDALQDVMANIADINTDPKAKRAITLTFTFNANEERKAGKVLIACSKKLAGFRGHSVDIYYGQQHGRFTAVEAPKQDEMFPTPDARPRVVEPAVPAERTA